jgi:hypothetical protein
MDNQFKGSPALSAVKAFAKVPKVTLLDEVELLLAMDI